MEMNLCELRDMFMKMEDIGFIFSEGFNKPHSYRGYYDEVAFEPAYGVCLKEVQFVINKALTDTFYGWRGGVYTYSEDTPIHLAYKDLTADSSSQSLVRDMIYEYNSQHGKWKWQ